MEKKTKCSKNDSDTATRTMLSLLCDNNCDTWVFFSLPFKTFGTLRLNTILDTLSPKRDYINTFDFSSLLCIIRKTRTEKCNG